MSSRGLKGLLRFAACLEAARLKLVGCELQVDGGESKSRTLRQSDEEIVEDALEDTGDICGLR